MVSQEVPGKMSPGWYLCQHSVGFPSFSVSHPHPSLYFLSSLPSVGPPRRSKFQEVHGGEWEEGGLAGMILGLQCSCEWAEGESRSQSHSVEESVSHREGSMYHPTVFDR